MTTNPYAEAAVTEALSFTSEDIGNAQEAMQEAMQEGEWQWFQWLLREKAKQALPVLLAPVRALADEWEADGPHAAFWGAQTRLRMVLDAIEAGATSEGGQS